MNSIQRRIHHLNANFKLQWRFLLIKCYNLFTKRLPMYSLPQNINSILIMVQEKIGDAILTFPLIKALHEIFPTCEISILTTNYNSWLFSDIPFINRVLIYKPNKNLSNELAKQSYQVFYYLKDNPSFTGIKISQQVRADIKICLDVPLHNKNFNCQLTHKFDAHIIEKNAALLQKYNIQFPIANWFPIPDASHTYIKDQLLRNSLSKYITINLSSGPPIRRWTDQKWSELLCYLENQKSATNAILFAVGEDKQLASNLKKKFPSFIMYPNMTRNLYDVAELISQSVLVISPDTSLVHIAAAVNTPVITLYNHTERNYKVFAPYNIPHKNVISLTRYVSDIPVDSVIDAYEELIKEQNL